MEEAESWHKEARLYEVFDVAGDTVGATAPIGMFYLDMHPRDGKYGHAAVWGLQPGCANSAVEGGRQIPIAAGHMHGAALTLTLLYSRPDEF